MNAKYVFVGLDANYDANVDRTPFFARLREYHLDGPAFWRRYKVHHPFLLSEYKGDGRFYHQSFTKLGFEPGHADQVSFVELLPAPTVGRNPTIDALDLEPTHMAWLLEALRHGVARFVFLPSGVLRLLRTQPTFHWLPSAPSGEFGGLAQLCQLGSKRFLLHLHFSVWGKSAQKKRREAQAIQQIVRGDA